MLSFPVQFHGCGDEAGVWGDTKHSLWVWLRINREPRNEKIRREEKDISDRRQVLEKRRGGGVKNKSKGQLEMAEGSRVKEADGASVWGSDKEVWIQMA